MRLKIYSLTLLTHVSGVVQWVGRDLVRVLQRLIDLGWMTPISTRARWPLGVDDRSLRTPHEPQVALLAHLGENFMTVPKFFGQLARGGARDRAVAFIACVDVRA